MVETMKRVFILERELVEDRILVSFVLVAVVNLNPEPVGPSHGKLGLNIEMSK